MLQLSKEDGQAAPVAIRREDYTAPAYWIDSVELTFDLDPAKTRVLNRMTLRRNADVPAQPLRLDGEDLNLARVLVNGQGTSFKMDGGQLVLENLPEGTDAFALEIFTTCAPAKNTKLMGLYVSNDSFFTQCEAQGFRRITPFPDRPDVMARFHVTLEADEARYPVLLSNGNLQETARLPGGRHRAVWVDPFPKPCYLFALVAADLPASADELAGDHGRDHAFFHAGGEAEVVAEGEGGADGEGHVDDLAPVIHVLHHGEHGNVVGQGGHHAGGRHVVHAQGPAGGLQRLLAELGQEVHQREGPGQDNRDGTDDRHGFT